MRNKKSGDLFRRLCKRFAAILFCISTVLLLIYVMPPIDGNFVISMPHTYIYTTTQRCTRIYIYIYKSICQRVGVRDYYLDSDRQTGETRLNNLYGKTYNNACNVGYAGWMLVSDFTRTHYATIQLRTAAAAVINIFNMFSDSHTHTFLFLLYSTWFRPLWKDGKTPRQVL